MTEKPFDGHWNSDSYDSPLVPWENDIQTVRADKEEINFLENYLEWKNDRQLYPPVFSPTEYGNHLHNLRNEEIIESAIKYLDFYDKGIQVPSGVVQTLLEILRDEKK